MPEPRPCFVLGCGRSGTSLAAGLLAEAGYDFGPGLLRPDPSNPKGFFESRTVNRLNERLLAPVATAVPVDETGRPAAARPLREGERWLATLADDVDVPPLPGASGLGESDELLAAASGTACTGEAQGAGVVGRARKDPRFVWTLPLWERVMPGALRLCVFREPVRTARSILRMTDTGDLGLTLPGALGVWTAAYRRCLRLADSDGGEWLFVHYDQLLDGTAVGGLSDRLGVALPGRFADPTLRRTPDSPDVPSEAAAVLAELCERAQRA